MAYGIKKFFDQFEECVNLYNIKNLNKSILALIIVDSIYDMYANSYVQDLYAIATRELNSSRKLKRACEMNNIFIEDDYLKQYEYQKNYIFENRSKFAGRLNILEKNNIIGTEQKETIKILHTFRNVYLHQSKQKESYLNAVVSTYMYLLGKLFEAIPINKYCSVEDDCKYVENNTHILERDQRKKILDYFFNQNSFIYSLLSCAKDLKSFIQEKIASVEDFIFNVFGEGKSEIVFNFSNRHNLGIITNKYDNKIKFLRLEKFKKRAENLREIIEESKLFKTFNNLNKEIEEFSLPIINECQEAALAISIEVDVRMGK